MQLVKKGGVQPEGSKELGFVYKCPHDGATRETPGPCPKCQMPLDDRHKVAKEAPTAKLPELKPGESAGQEYVYRCPMDGALIDKPGPCPKCKMALDERHKVPKAKPAEARTIYFCDVHPEEVFERAGRCVKDT